MKQVTISSKNQITLPSAILRTQKLRPGQKLYVTEEDGIIALSSKNPLEQYVAKALYMRSRGLGDKNPPDPLKFRQELRDEWTGR